MSKNGDTHTGAEGAGDGLSGLDEILLTTPSEHQLTGAPSADPVQHGADPPVSTPRTAPGAGNLDALLAEPSVAPDGPVVQDDPLQIGIRLERPHDGTMLNWPQAARVAAFAVGYQRFSDELRQLLHEMLSIAEEDKVDAIDVAQRLSTEGGTRMVAVGFLTEFLQRTYSAHLTFDYGVRVSSYLAGADQNLVKTIVHVLNMVAFRFPNEGQEPHSVKPSNKVSVSQLIESMERSVSVLSPDALEALEVIFELMKLWPGQE